MLIKCAITLMLANCGVTLMLPNVMSH
jgi:hypothetical protein